MKFNIYATNDYLEENLLYYLKKVENSIVQYFEYDDSNIKGDKIIFVCDKWDPKYLQNISAGRKIYILTKDLNLHLDRLNTLICKIKPLEDILNDMWKKSIIPENFNASLTENALEKFVSMVVSDSIGFFNLINPGIIKAQDVVNFYNVNKKITFIKEHIIPYSHPELIDISDRFLPTNNKIVNVYIPVYYRFNKTKNCIESIRKAASESSYDVKLYIGDNNTKLETMKNWLKNIEEEVFFSSKNIGKANIVNKMHSISRKCDYIFSIDGDMCADNTKDYNIFDSMIMCLEKGENVGLVSSFQYGQCEHWFNGTIQVEKSNNIYLGFSKSGIGIAGGCIVMKTKDWDKIGGYKENHDIYTGDDGILTYKVYRYLNKVCAVSMDYGMIHPGPEEDEKGYLEWKRKRWQKDNLNFLKDNYTGSVKKGYYD